MTTAWKRCVWASALAMVFGLAHAAAAQDADADKDATDLAKQTQNPIASLISVPFQGNWNFGIGDDGATATLLNIQPVIPFAVSKTTNVILRIIMPLTSQPGPDNDFTINRRGNIFGINGPENDFRINGMGDVVATAFFSPSKPNRLIWGAGPVFLLPTATNNALGSEKFGIGPSVVVLTQPQNWTVGLLFNQIWSTSGATDRIKVNRTFLQPFINYNLGSGLSVGASMEATGDWEATDHWTAPLFFNVSKVTRLGERPVNLQVAAGPLVASPSGGSSWQFRLAVTFLFPRKSAG